MDELSWLIVIFVAFLLLPNAVVAIWEFILDIILAIKLRKR